MRGRLAVGFVILGSLWTCDTSTKLAKASANGHRAELVRVTRTSKSSGGGHFGPSCDKVIQVEHVELTIDGVARDVTSEWSKGGADLVAQSDGDRFAYRMNSGPWRPVWRGTRHVILGGDAQRISAASVDWKAMPVFAIAAKDIFRHAKNERERVVEELSGTPQRATLLADTIDADGEIDDIWSRTFRALTPDQQQGLRELLTKRIVVGEKNPNIVMRYARDVGIRSERERSAVLAMLASVHTHGMKHRVKEHLVVQASRVDLGATARWACQEVARYGMDKFFYPTELFWVMAKARHSCPAALPQLSILPGCAAEATGRELEETIDTALGKLVDERAAQNAAYIPKEQALVAFATRTLSEEERNQHCRPKP